MSINEAFAPAYAAFHDGHHQEAVAIATTVLCGLRNTALAEGGIDRWKEKITQLRASDFFHIALQDPFTHHSYTKPRGYPGDALLLDWIYRDFRLLTPPDKGSMSAAIYRQTIDNSPPESVRWRRQHLADLIDAAAMVNPHIRILALASGHLREADLSQALQNGQVAEIVALDQDAETLKEVKRCYTDKGLPVRTMHTPIKEVIAGRYHLGKFDLIYSAGLYDYLPAPVAEQLTSQLWQHLNPGGQMILTNFLESTPDHGWMEAMADWWLIFRNQAEIRAFAKGVPAAEIKRELEYICPTGNVGYLSMRKIN